MPTDLEMAARVRAAQRAADAMALLVERLKYRESLVAARVPDCGMDRALASQTDLENAQREVELALKGMAEAGCDAESTAKVETELRQVAPAVRDLRERMEDLRPVPKPNPQPGMV
jgi:hypothetical protein